MVLYCGDFETITKEQSIRENHNIDLFENWVYTENEFESPKTRIWVWGIAEIDNEKNFFYDNDMESFINWCKNSKTNDTIYFHNIDFDGSFIIDYLFNFL